MVRYVGLGKESSFASAASIARYVDPVTFSLTPEKEPVIFRTVASRSPVTFYEGKVTVTGDIEIPLYPDVLGDFLLMLLGKVETSQPDAGSAPNTYKHTFTPIEKWESPVTYTLELGEDVIARRILGAILESLSLELTPGEPPRAGCSVLAVKEESTSLGSPTFPSVKAFPENSATLTLNGASAELQALSLDINNNPSTDHHVIGSKYLTRHELGDLEITGSFDVKLADRTHLDQFLSDGEGSLEIMLEGEEIEAGYKHYLKISLPRIIYSGWEAEVSGSEPIVQSIDFAAIKPSDSPIITIELQNKISSY